MITHRNRIIEIASVPLYHGIVERAVLYFSTRWDNWSTTAAVGFYSLTNPYQPFLTGWLPSAEYSYWYRRLALGKAADALLRHHADRWREPYVSKNRARHVD